jgi:sec-independent protein translocase protein TatB
MFDVSWSELLILGVVTLIFVGPKELPRFLGTLGRYAGIVRRQAGEFRAVFDQAMREAEMDELQKEVRAVSDGVKASLDDATRSVGEAAAKIETDVQPRALSSKTDDAEAAAPPLDVAEASVNPAAEPSIGVPSSEGGSSSEAESNRPADQNSPAETSSDATSRPV